jgi:hypothetical protein
MLAWTFAGVIAGEYLSKTGTSGGVLYRLGVSLTRVPGQEYFPSDVLVGAAAGWLIGHYVFEKHQVPSAWSPKVESRNSRTQDFDAQYPRIDFCSSSHRKLCSQSERHMVHSTWKFDIQTFPSQSENSEIGICEMWRAYASRFASVLLPAQKLG